VSRLQRVNLKIESGERLVLVGPSGAGKSLLLELLFGMRLPTSGHVTVDGVDLRDVQPDALRRRVALVREIEVFRGTVAENVHLERQSVSTADVRAALAAVDLLDEVLDLAEGLETELRDGGFPLTRNQARRLMIARAIVTRPGLLLIDGALDALPDDEVQRLTRMLVDPEQPWTLMIVTGRELITGAIPRIVQLDGASDATGGPIHVG
jgi:ABC-type multidrug transport system fused ATPase/permease subunit